MILKAWRERKRGKEKKKYIIKGINTGLGRKVQVAKRRVQPRARTAAQHWWAANTLIYALVYGI